MKIINNLPVILAIFAVGSAFADSQVVIGPGATSANCYGDDIGGATTGSVQYNAIWWNCALAADQTTTIAAQLANHASVASLTPVASNDNKCTYSIVCKDGYSLASAVNSGSFTVATPNTSVTATDWNTFCEANKITLSWKDEDGTTDIEGNPSSCDYMNTISPLVVPTKSGYTFMGWEIAE